MKPAIAANNAESGIIHATIDKTASFDQKYEDMIIVLCNLELLDEEDEEGCWDIIIDGCVDIVSIPVVIVTGLLDDGGGGGGGEGGEGGFALFMMSRMTLSLLWILLWLL